MPICHPEDNPSYAGQTYMQAAALRHIRLCEDPYPADPWKPFAPPSCNTQPRRQVPIPPGKYGACANTNELHTTLRRFRVDQSLEGFVDSWTGTVFTCDSGHTLPVDDIDIVTTGLRRCPRRSCIVVESEAALVTLQAPIVYCSLRIHGQRVYAVRAGYINETQ